MTVPTIMLVLPVIVAVLAAWVWLGRWLMHRVVDPWLLRRFRLPPEDKP